MTRRALIISEKLLKKLSLIFFIFCTGLIGLFAEPIIDEENKFSLDIPEGFEIEDYSEDGNSFLFNHPNFPVKFTMQILQDKADLNAKQALELQLNKLKAKFTADTFYWNQSLTSITDFSMNFMNQEYSGWGLCAKLQNGLPLVILAFSPEESREKTNLFLISILNSLCIDDNFYNKPGPVVSYAFPSEGKKDITFDFRDKIIHATIDKSDEEAAQFIVDMEHSILILYGNHPKKDDAIQRYYRMIYRDNSGRIEDCVSKILTAAIQSDIVKKSQKPDLTACQEFLYWVQTFSYERDLNNADFTNLVSVMCGKGNDCDSRSMLVSLLVKSMGYESVLLVSTEYSHALSTLEMNEPGMKYELKGTDRYFLYGETTSKGCTWGMIASTQQNQDLWVPVILP